MTEINVNYSRFIINTWKGGFPPVKVKQWIRYNNTITLFHSLEKTFEDYFILFHQS